MRTVIEISVPLACVALLNGHVGNPTLAGVLAYLAVCVTAYACGEAVGRIAWRLTSRR